MARNYQRKMMNFSRYACSRHDTITYEERKMIDEYIATKGPTVIPDSRKVLEISPKGSS